MTRARRTTLLTFLFVACTGPITQAQAPTPAEAKALAAQYVSAVNAKDMARITALYHPGTVACITPETKDFYDGAIQMSMRDPIPADYKVSVMPVNEGNKKAMESMARFPVPPTSEMHIDYQQGNDLGGIVLWLARVNGRWYADQPCVSDATLKSFRDNKAEREAALAHYKELADGIKDPLRSQLLAMLRAHDSGTAMDRYHEASGQDMKTSMMVINALKAEAK